MSIPRKEATALFSFVACGENFCRREHAEKGEAFDSSSARVQLFGGRSLVLGEETADEELYVHGSRVVWSAGGVVRKALSFDEPVLQACWCHFESCGESAVLCTLQKHLMTIYRLSGELESSPFTHGFAKMWPLPEGLLLEGRDSAYALMTGPLEALQPVITSLSDDEFGWWDGEAIVWSSPEEPYLVTYNEVHLQLSIWNCSPVSTSRIPDHILKMTPGLHLSPKASPQVSTAGVPIHSTTGRNKVRMSNGELSPMIFSHTAMDSGSGPYSLRSSKKNKLLKAFTTFRAIFTKRLYERDVPDEVCMVSSGMGTSLVCTLCTGTSKLMVFHLQKNSRQTVSLSRVEDDVASISAVSPFAEVGENPGPTARHLLVLSTSGVIRVWRVYLPASAIFQNPYADADDVGGSIAHPRHVDFFKMDDSIQTQAIKLCDPVGNRVTIDLRNGSRVRCAVKLSPAWPLPSLAMRVLRPCIGEEGYWEIYNAWLRQKGTGEDDSESDWRGFCAVFHGYVEKAQENVNVPDMLTPRRGRRSLPAIDTRCSISPMSRLRANSVGAFLSPKSGMIGTALYQQAWKQCLESQRAERLQLDKKFKWMKADSSSPKMLLDGRFGGFQSEAKLAQCLEALHVLYEEFKLDMKKWSLLLKLGKFLVGLAFHVGADKYIDHYARDLGTAVVRDLGVQFPLDKSKIPICADSPRPADIYRALQATLTGTELIWFPWQQHFSFAQTSTDLLHVYQRLHEAGQQCAEFCGEDKAACLQKQLELVVKLLVDQGWDIRSLESLPYGIALPIRECIQRCKGHPPQGWPLEAYALLGRDDIVATLSGNSERYPDTAPPHSSGPAPTRRSSTVSVYTPNARGIRKCNLLEEQCKRFPVRLPYNYQLWIPVAEVEEADVERANMNSSATGGDGEDVGVDDATGSIGDLCFSRDNRLQEVWKLLCSSTPCPVGSEADGDDGGPEIHRNLQTRLLSLSARTLSLSVGRGAMLLQTMQLHPTEELVVPELCLSGKLPGKAALVRLDTSLHNTSDGSGAADFSLWPEFHNGVAAGLAMKQKGTGISQSWLSCNFQRPPSYSSAGVILALGLAGHMDKLNNPQVSRYLAMQHTATTIAILLGLGASRIGTMDTNANTTMFLHLPHKIPHNIPEVELSSHIQAANLMALGLLYKCTSHRMMTALMLEEIGRRPGKNTTVDFGCGFTQGGVTTDREGYALAAGFGLGLINLGRGGQGCGIDDKQIEDTLRYYMLGGKNPQPNVYRVHRAAPPPHHGLEGLLGPGGTVWDPELGDMDLVKHLPGIESLSRDNPSRGPDGDHAQVVLEGEMVNLDVTSPAATVALALMYIRTNNSDIAGNFKIPQSKFELDYVRPDFIMLRVLGRALVMWDEITPTRAWIQAQLPTITSSQSQGGHLPAHVDHAADPLVLEQAHVNAVAGACMAVGLKYAGTGDSLARSTLHFFVMRFLKFKKSTPENLDESDTHHDHIDKQALETVLDACALSLSIVMSGTGHLPTFRLLRGLHLRLQPGPTGISPNTGNSGGLRYGNHMAINMALGFLFLGNGHASFRTDNTAVASLLIAIFPKFPQNTLDHRCHLQAFRHMYVLAVQCRTISAVDVDTGESVSVPLEITLNPDSFLEPTPSDSKPPRHDPSFADAPEQTGVKRPHDAWTNVPKDAEQHSGNDVMQCDQSRNKLVLETPCLLPDQQEVKSIEVTGPRYWPLLIDGSAGSALAPVYDRLQIFVKKKSGVLSYTQDPLGNRALLSSAFHQCYHMPSPQGGYDLVNLCGTYAADLSVMGFAQMFCLTGGQNNESKGCGPPSVTHEFQLFCRRALYDCIKSERPEMLQPHIYFYALVHGVSTDIVDSSLRLPEIAQGGGLTVGLWNLRLCREFYRSRLGCYLLDLASTSGNEARQNNSLAEDADDCSFRYVRGDPLISPVFLNDLWSLLEQCWDKWGFLGSQGADSTENLSALQYFVQTGDWNVPGTRTLSSGILDLMFGVFLNLCDIPSFEEIKSAIKTAQELSFSMENWQDLFPVVLMKLNSGFPGSTAQMLLNSVL